MQVKHTVLLVFVSSLIWVGVLFANAGQPLPGVNGVLGDNQYCSCHTGGFTSATMVSGLPAEWTPNTDYHLTVTVPTGGVKYGFELSATYSSSTTQAGTLSIEAGGAPATLIAGSGATAGLTFAGHNVSDSNNVYKVLWHSPSTPGAVRIDVGAVRANGDGSRLNDTVYADSRILPTADTTNPTVTITSPTSNPTFATSSTPITLQGTASDDIGVTQVTWMNDRGGSATCTGTTAWTCSNIALQPGVNNLTVRASDAAANFGEDILTVTLDTTLPTVTITTPTSNPTYVTGTSPITLQGTASDNVGVTQVTWANHRGGSAACTGTTAWTCSDIPLQSGMNILTISAVDAATNAGTDILTVTFTNSPLPPTLSALSPSSGARGSSVNVTFTGTGFFAGMTINAGSGITVSNVNVVSAVGATATFTIASGAMLGVRSVTVVTGNGTSGTMPFTVNPAPPLDDLVVDFGAPYGIYTRTSNGVWVWLHPQSAQSITRAKLDPGGLDDLVIDFGAPNGIWAYLNNASWVYLHPFSARSITRADLDGNGKDDLVIDFGPTNGIWVYLNNASWVYLHPFSAQAITRADLDGNGRDDLVIDFGAPHGIYVYLNNASWLQLHPFSARSITRADLDGNGRDDLVIDFGSPHGIYAYLNNSSWLRLHPFSALSVARADLDGNGMDDLAIDFGPLYGIYALMNNTIWSSIDRRSATQITAADVDKDGRDDLVIGFLNSQGTAIFLHGGPPTPLHNLGAKVIVAADLDGQ